MPLEIPNLDNRRWSDLVEEARSLIPRVAPRWTDHNVHDPGITFIELFAWLAEMQLYQLNRVGRKHREVFGRLAGVSRGLRTAARVNVQVEGRLNDGLFLGAGTQLTPLEGSEMVFETVKDLFVTRTQLIRVITEDKTGQIDQTDANAKPGVTFLPFGEDAGQDARLILGFDNFYPNEQREIRLTADLFTDDLSARCSADDPLQTQIADDSSGVDIFWEYLTGSDQWSPLQVRSDETGSFASSGSIAFTVPTDAVRSGDYFWIRAGIRNGYFDIEPRLRSISLNALPCLQRETVRNEILGRGNGKPDQTFTLKKGPVLVPETGPRSSVVSSDVVDWDLLAEKLTNIEPPFATFLNTNLRSAEANKFAAYERINALNAELARSGSVLRSALQSEEPKSATDAEIDELLGHAPIVITVDNERWTAVPSFDDSDPQSKHYVFDNEKGYVQFGNRLNGQVPSTGQQVSAIWYRVSAGAAGNVGKDLNWRFRNAAIPGITLRNLEPATGGKDPEPLDEMELRIRSLLNRPQRAVTAADFELLALSTPSAHVARAKAIANCPVGESISVVALPKIRPGRKGKPKSPSKPFLHKVERQLQRSRLLCDNIRVLSPIYIEVRVSARLRLTKGAGPEAVLDRAREALDRFLYGDLQPTRRTSTPDRESVRKASLQSPCPTKWPFGRSVFPSEVYAILDAVPGVDFVSNLILSASRNSNAIVADKTGAIPVPSIGLAFPGPHDLSVDSNSGRDA
jgi:hypothetical protein